MSVQPVQPMIRIVLGSTSVYRRTVLEKLRLPFEVAAPNIDETRLADESALDMVKRLSLQKAEAIVLKHPEALIIGSDQCAVLGEEILGKPGNHENAVAQLSASSGNTVHFLTGLCLYDARSGSYQLDCIPYEVAFRDLTPAEIEAYVQQEKPFNCAGSFKSEGYGISLFKHIRGDDPNALIGLPLIRLAEMLRQHGFVIPG